MLQRTIYVASFLAKAILLSYGQAMEIHLRNKHPKRPREKSRPVSPAFQLTRRRGSKSLGRSIRLPSKTATAVQVGVVALVVAQKPEVLVTERAVEAVAVIEDKADVVTTGRTYPGQAMHEMFSRRLTSKKAATICTRRNKAVKAAHTQVRAAALKLVPMETIETNRKGREHLNEDHPKLDRAAA